MVRWLLGIVSVLVITAAGTGWYRTYDYVNNGWREYKIVCWSPLAEVNSALKPEVFDLFSGQLQFSYPGDVKIEGSRIFLRPYVHLFDPQNLGKLSLGIMAEKLDMSIETVGDNCRKLVGMFVQDTDPDYFSMSYADENEWLRVLSFFSPRNDWHRIKGTPPWEKSPQ